MSSCLCVENALSLHSFVASRIDYCNAVLAGAPKATTNKLQRVLNAAAHVVSGTPVPISSTEACRDSFIPSYIGWTPQLYRLFLHTALLLCVSSIVTNEDKAKNVSFYFLLPNSTINIQQYRRFPGASIIRGLVFPSDFEADGGRESGCRRTADVDFVYSADSV